jgi:hypothetical protein
LIRTFVEQDLPQLGITIGARTIHRFWTMLAHYHAQIWSGAELARAFGIAESTVKRYLDLLANTFMVRVLPPWRENMGKRVVKIYIADTGLLHALLDIPSARALHARPEQCYFWATHQGAVPDGDSGAASARARRCRRVRERVLCYLRSSLRPTTMQHVTSPLLARLGEHPATCWMVAGATTTRSLSPQTTGPVLEQCLGEAFVGHGDRRGHMPFSPHRERLRLRCGQPSGSGLAYSAARCSTRDWRSWTPLTSPP